MRDKQQLHMYLGHEGSAILQVAGCGLQVAGHKYKMSPVAMHTLRLILVYYS
jgi:hypothetical protein